MDLVTQLDTHRAPERANGLTMSFASSSRPGRSAVGDRELEDSLGLDHFERRSYLGWHRHVTLTALTEAFCTSLRDDPKALAPA